jgi:hypothetical protein
MEADGWGYTDGTPGPVCSGREGLGEKKAVLSPWALRGVTQCLKTDEGWWG